MVSADSKGLMDDSLVASGKTVADSKGFAGRTEGVPPTPYMFSVSADSKGVRCWKSRKCGF